MTSRIAALVDQSRAIVIDPGELIAPSRFRHTADMGKRVIYWFRTDLRLHGTFVSTHTFRSVRRSSSSRARDGRLACTRRGPQAQARGPVSRLDMGVSPIGDGTQTDVNQAEFSQTLGSPFATFSLKPSLCLQSVCRTEQMAIPARLDARCVGQYQENQQQESAVCRARTSYDGVARALEGVGHHGYCMVSRKL